MFSIGQAILKFLILSFWLALSAGVATAFDIVLNEEPRMNIPPAEDLQENSLIDEGRKYANGGEFEKAIEFFEKAIRLNSKSTAHCWKGLVFQKLSYKAKADAAIGKERKLLEKALKAYKDYAQAMPHSLTAHWYLGNIYSLLKQYDSAIHHYNKAVALSYAPERISIIYTRAVAFKDSGDYESAIRDAMWLVSYVGVATATMQVAGYSGHMVSAESLINLGRYSDALLEIQKAEKYLYTPQVAVTTEYWRGRAYEGLGKKKEAIEAYRKLLNLSPGYWDVQKRLNHLTKE